MNPDTPPVLSVIIVNWNSKDYVRDCLTSFYEHCRSVPFEIIVVDGASFDGCDTMLAAEFPAVRFIQSPENVGFARANNLGARQARGEFLLLLNPDTLLLEDSPAVLLEALRTLPDAGLVGCRLLNRDRSIQLTSILRFPTVLNRTFGSAFLNRLFPRWSGIAPLLAQQSAPCTVEAVSGACMCVPRALFEEIGGFTEKYFMYGEDVDLCFKVRRAGHAVVHTPKTSIVHFGGGSSKQAASDFSVVAMRTSWHLFFLLNRGPLHAALFRAVTGLSAVFRLLVILPLLVFGNRVVKHGTDSLRKWRAILNWSLGRLPQKVAVSK
jgi:GT2 family glycosyltransferase